MPFPAPQRMALIISGTRADFKNMDFFLKKYTFPVILKSLSTRTMSSFSLPLTYMCISMRTQSKEFVEFSRALTTHLKRIKSCPFQMALLLELCSTTKEWLLWSKSMNLAALLMSLSSVSIQSEPSTQVVGCGRFWQTTAFKILSKPVLISNTTQFNFNF